MPPISSSHGDGGTCTGISATLAPCYIMTLSALWLGPLASFLAVTATSGSPRHRGIAFAVVAVMALGTLTAAALPEAYFRLRAWEQDGSRYVRLGVRWVRRLAPYGDWMNLLARRLGQPYRLSVRSAPSLAERERQTRLNERVHWAVILAVIPAAAGVLALGQILLGLYLCLVIPVSSQCIFLQRYNRARLAHIEELIAGRA
jgi:hypothetical protein